MFYGIIVMMYYFDTDRHNIPHIHVKYAEYSCVVNILNGEILEGNLPKKKMKLLEA